MIVKVSYLIRDIFFSHQAYFYENLHQCKESYKPSFGGSLNDLLLKINAARRDDLLIPGNAPSTASRFVHIKDSDTNPNCTDAKVCPLNYFRNNRIFVYSLPIDHPDLVDLDKYKVAEILLNFRVSMMTSWYGNTFCITGPWWGEPTWFPTESVWRHFDISFALNLNQLLNKQSNCGWFVTPPLSWYVTVVIIQERSLEMSSPILLKTQCVYLRHLTSLSKTIHPVGTKHQFDGLVQERRNQSALAIELRLSCINSSN